jgi:hypothetical protein
VRVLKRIELEGEAHYMVEGESGVYTVVKRESGEFTCTCPSFRYGRRSPCKHIKLAQEVGGWR